MRYLRLYLHFVRFSFSRALEFRLDFYFRVVMDCVFYAVNLAFFHVIYRHTSQLGGWDQDQAVIFVCAFLLVDALSMTFFSNNLWILPILINRGDLDYYLVRPVSTLFFLSLRDFAANSFMNLIIAGGLMAWAILRYPGAIAAAGVATFLVLIGAAVFIHYLIRMIFIVPVFWLHTSRGLDEVMFNIEKLGERPHQIFGDWLRRIMLSVMPLAFIASVPTHALFDGPTPALLAHLVAVVGGLYVVVLALWRFGLRSYSSASS
jgi:ABC-2 type transport system permease protein